MLRDLKINFMIEAHPWAHNYGEKGSQNRNLAYNWPSMVRTVKLFS